MNRQWAGDRPADRRVVGGRPPAGHRQATARAVDTSAVAPASVVTVTGEVAALTVAAGGVPPTLATEQMRIEMNHYLLWTSWIIQLRGSGAGGWRHPPSPPPFLLLLPQLWRIKRKGQVTWRGDCSIDRCWLVGLLPSGAEAIVDCFHRSASFAVGWGFILLSFYLDFFFSFFFHLSYIFGFIFISLSPLHTPLGAIPEQFQSNSNSRAVLEQCRSNFGAFLEQIQNISRSMPGQIQSNFNSRAILEHFQSDSGAIAIPEPFKSISRAFLEQFQGNSNQFLQYFQNKKEKISRRGGGRQTPPLSPSLEPITRHTP